MSLSWLRRHHYRGLFMASIVASGCGGRDPNELPTVPAAGTVTYQGKPVAKGGIQFQPEKGHPASGAIADGKFTLTTYQDGDGAVAGKHKVGVSVTEEAKAKDGDTTVKYLIPEKYANPDRSGIVAEVPAGGSKDIKVDIK